MTIEDIKIEPGQVWITHSGARVEILSRDENGKVRVKSKVYPVQAVHEADFIPWIKAVRAHLQPPSVDAKLEQAISHLLMSYGIRLPAQYDGARMDERIELMDLVARRIVAVVREHEDA